jgi:2-dehydro-3-deoxy-D-arabinonate dehydratase
MKRAVPELINFLMRNNPVPPGSICLTGTGIVPPDDFSLRENDLVEISIDNIGTLRNPVKQL